MTDQHLDQQLDKQQILQLLSQQQITPAQAKALLQGKPMPIADVVKQQLGAYPKSAEQKQDIAIVGIGLQLPGAKDKEQFWQNLLNGRCSVNNLSKARWQQPHYSASMDKLTKVHGHWGGFLPDVQGFDHSFFNITAEDAKSFDPQHKLLMQTSFHAIEDAGMNKQQLAGQNCGVYIGINESDFAEYLVQNSARPIEHIDGWLASFAAGRLSYFYDLKGPALNIDTACSSSLVALHNACQAIHNGDCDFALAGGTTVNNTPEQFRRLNNLGIISSRGRCAPFDEQADGTVLSEGIVVVVLMPLEMAKKDNHRIHGVIKATATNQDGRSNGISAPNGAAQKALLELVYGAGSGIESGSGRLDPASIGLFEAHGTGTNLGDPVELAALCKVFSGVSGRCSLSALKANIGHTGQTAGLAGLVKVLMAMRHKTLPPQINFHQLNSKIDLSGTPLFIDTQAKHWGAERTRRGAVNSFGIMGTNAHAVLEEYQAPARVAPANYSHHLILLSAQSLKALASKIEQLAAFLQQHPTCALADIAYTLASRREHFRAHRFAVVVNSLSALLNALQLYSGEPAAKNTLKADIDSLMGELEQHPAAALEPLTVFCSGYTNKQTIDWSRLYPAEHYQVVDLPQYPFVTRQEKPVETGNNQVYFLFAKYLGINEADLNPNADYDELGIDSMSLMKVAAMLQQKFSQPITVETLITHNTPKAIFSFVNGLEYESKIDTNFCINMSPVFDFMAYLPEMSSGTFNHPELGIQEYVTGGQGTPILLMPPVDCPASAWLFQIRHLVKNYRLIVMHYPGYSHSEFRGFKVSFEQLANLVPVLLDHLKLSQVDVVGWSQGGLISQLFAAKHPSRIKKLLLCNTAAHLKYLKNSESIEHLFNTLKADFNGFEQAIAQKVGVDSLASFIKGSTSNTVFLNYAREILNHNSTTLLENIKAPTMVIAGKNDELTTLDHAQVLADRIEGAKYVVHPTAGHYIPLANARYFNQKLDEFLLGNDLAKAGEKQ